MKRRNHTPEQIVRKLGGGYSVLVACKHLEITEQPYYRRRNQYGGFKTDDAKRLKEFRRGNAVE